MLQHIAEFGRFFMFLWGTSIFYVPLGEQELIDFMNRYMSLLGYKSLLERTV